MYAVIKTGGKQYKVSEGDLFKVEMLDGAVGKLGTPLVPGAKVKAQIVAQEKDKKILVFKSKRRGGSRKKYGHRQPITRLKVAAIEV